MSDKVKVIIAVGGTGGHVFPGCSLASHLAEKKFDISMVSDKRGYKYLEKFKNFKISILHSHPISKKIFFRFLFLLFFYSTQP